MKLTLSESIAVKTFARFGQWPSWFEPSRRVAEHAQRMRREELFAKACIASLDREGERLGMQLWPPKEWFE